MIAENLVGIRSAYRAGLSLMEVLISIAVIAIGLLGVAVLLPVAGKAARDGITYDNATRVGQNMLREFQLRGFAQPDAWYSADNTVPPIVVQQINNTNTMTCDLVFGVNPSYEAFVDDRQPGPMGPTSLNQRIPLETGDTLTQPDPGYQGIDVGASSVRLARHKKAFCIDPLFYARQIANNNITIPTLSSNRYTFFPAIAVSQADEPRMKRVTLRNSAGGGPMLLSQADKIFRYSDDLSLETDRDPLILPKQIFAREPNTGRDVVRESEGRLSWFATIAPRTTMLADQQDLYTLSIVVCRARTFFGIEEQMAFVSGATGAGVGGGEVELTSSLPMSLRQGDWLMLARYHDFGSGFEPLFKWYRVSATDGVTNVVKADVTLQGPDWNFDPVLITYAFLVNDVVAVYERTIRLDTSSLWGY
ncbi:MAG: prepilin-type N-terminal cleavage/methylation domain-containing protein [Planctomycetes bacterium]|nr:prepilin-type N-terminal cleavage/methylation domain-containing protein [Planctomycetota bacterium]